MSDFIGLNLEFNDFDRLLRQDDLVETPVPIQVFVQDKKYLGLPPLSPIQEEIVKHSTQILKERTLISLHGEEAGREYYKKYTDNEVICMLGKGSGKDHCSRISIAYTAYLLHCLRDPLSYFGKAHGVYIDLLNLALTNERLSIFQKLGIAFQGMINPMAKDMLSAELEIEKLRNVIAC